MGDKFNGVACDQATGLVVAVPKDGADILVYDTTTGAARSVDISSYVSCKAKFLGVCCIDGQFVMAPHYSSSILVYRQTAFKLVLLDIDGSLLICSDVTGQELIKVPVDQCPTLRDLRVLLSEFVGMSEQLRFMRAGSMCLLDGSSSETITEILN